jgi:hypothetical protein
MTRSLILVSSTLHMTHGTRLRDEGPPLSYETCAVSDQNQMLDFNGRARSQSQQSKYFFDFINPLCLRTTVTQKQIRHRHASTFHVWATEVCPKTMSKSSVLFFVNPLIVPLESYSAMHGAHKCNK